MLTEATPRFPPGSIIVKEKLVGMRSSISVDDGRRIDSSNGIHDMPELLTVMIKREPGYNPDAGDWEFLVYSGDARQIQARGKLENCMRCHIPKAETDYVFRDYLPDDLRKQLKIEKQLFSDRSHTPTGAMRQDGN